MTKLSIILVHYNNTHDLEYYFKQLRDQSFTDFEVIIMDNNSDYQHTIDLDLLIKKFKKHSELNIKIFYNSANKGYAYGVNHGIKKSSCDLILISNTDIYFDHLFLKDAVKYMEEDNYNIMSPKIYYTDTGKIWSSGGFFDFTNYRNQEIKNKQIYDITEVDYISGCAMFVKRDVFKRNKLFDENFFMYWEDSDFCYRAKKNGFKIIYNPRITISHNIDEEKERQSEFVKANYFKNKLLFIFKHYSLKLLLYCLPATIFITLVAFLKSKIKNRLIKSLKVIIGGISLGIRVRFL